MLDVFRKFKYRCNYIFAPYLNLSKPIDITLELASVCNQRCGYCYHSEQDKLPFKKGLMSLSTATKIINEAAYLNTPAIKFNWKGESTLNPIFKEVTSLAKSMSSGYLFQDRITNSNFKFNNNRDDIFDGLCNQTKVKISFDSFRAGVMHAQREGSIHELALKNIDKFYNYSKRKNTEIVIQAVRTVLNKDEDIAGNVNKRWPEASVSIRDMVSGRVNNSKTIALESVKRDFSNRKSCIQAHARLIFNFDGNAFPCCVDISESMNLGNINNKSLKEIFNSNEALELRKALKNKSAFSCGACKTCSSFESYKGYKPLWRS